MDNKAEFNALERISLEYISYERSFLRISIIIPVLFIIGQMMQFIIIFSNRKILPQELRGFLVIVLIIVLLPCDLCLWRGKRFGMYHTMFPLLIWE